MKIKIKTNRKSVRELKKKNKSFLDKRKARKLSWCREEEAEGGGSGYGGEGRRGEGGRGEQNDEKGREKN